MRIFAIARLLLAAGWRERRDGEEVNKWEGSGQRDAATQIFFGGIGFLAGWIVVLNFAITNIFH